MYISKNKKSQWLTNFCDNLRIFISIVMVQIVVIIYSFSFLTFDIEYLRKLSVLTILAQLVNLVLLITMCKLRIFFNKLEVTIGVILLTLIIIIVTTIITQILGNLNLQMTFHLFKKYDDTLYINFKLTLSSVLVCLALVRYFYIQDQWHKQIKELSNAQLKALQARIKPHFLFNSLNSITALIAIDPQKAEIAMINFADLMRKTFTYKDKEITIIEELKWLEQYLSIEKIRMGKRLNYQIKCSDKLMKFKIPVLCIQPLVENAIIHGIAPLENGGEIKISIDKQDKSLTIKIQNPYIEFATDKSNGMALRNISQRLELQYGNKAKFATHKKNNIHTAIMSIPL